MINKKLFAACVITISLCAAPAFAGDMSLPVKAPPRQVSSVYNWTGFYAGANAGGDRAYSGDPSTTTSCAGVSYFACANVPGVNAVGTGSMSGAGFTGGAQTGYNWQSGSTVLGAEADFEAMRGKASRTATGNYVTRPNQFTITSNVDADGLFTARGRLGWAFNNLLTYATGGLAVTCMSANNSFVDNVVGVGEPGVGSWGAAKTKAGWTAGGGAELALDQHWSARVEYLYVRFDFITASGLVINSTAVPGAFASPISTSTNLSVQIARAGFDYKF